MPKLPKLKFGAEYLVVGHFEFHNGAEQLRWETSRLIPSEAQLFFDAFGTTEGIPVTRFLYLDDLDDNVRLLRFGVAVALVDIF